MATTPIHPLYGTGFHPAYFVWPFWSKLPSVPPGGNVQHERWHLYQLHHVHFSSLVAAVASQCSAMVGTNVTIHATSAWVDASVYADFLLTEPGSKLKSTELADLLIDTHVSHGGQPAFRKAGLVQAKSTDKPDCFNSDCVTPGDGKLTNKERDLLEVHDGDISLYASGVGTGSGGYRAPITGPFALGNTFNVSVAPSIPRKRRQLMDYACYLLFPREKPAAPMCEPYQVLTPNNRLRRHGACIHYEQWLAALAIADSPVPLVDARPEWRGLVDTVQWWAQEKYWDGQTNGRWSLNFRYKNSSFVPTSLFAQTTVCMPASVLSTHFLALPHTRTPERIL